MALENSFCRSKGIATVQRSEKPQGLKPDMRAWQQSVASQPSKRQPSREKTGQQSSCRTAAETQRCQGHWAATVPQQATLRIWHSPSTDDGQKCRETSWIKGWCGLRQEKSTLRQIENVGGVNSAREQDSSVGGDAGYDCLGAVHMEEGVQDRVQVEVGREEQGEGEPHGESQNEEQTQQTVNRSSCMAMNMVWCANAETWAMRCDSHGQTRAMYRRKMMHMKRICLHHPVGCSGSPSTVNETNCNKKNHFNIYYELHQLQSDVSHHESLEEECHLQYCAGEFGSATSSPDSRWRRFLRETASRKSGRSRVGAFLPDIIQGEIPLSLVSFWIPLWRDGTCDFVLPIRPSLCTFVLPSQLWVVIHDRLGLWEIDREYVWNVHLESQLFCSISSTHSRQKNTLSVLQFHGVEHHGNALSWSRSAG